MPIPHSSHQSDSPEPSRDSTQPVTNTPQNSYNNLATPPRDGGVSEQSLLSLLPHTSTESQLAFCEITQRVKGSLLYHKLLDAKTSTTDFVDVITHPQTSLENKLLAGFVLKELKTLTDSNLTQFETERAIFYTLRSESNPQIKHALSLALQNPLPEIACELAELLDHPKEGDYASVALRGSVGVESVNPLRQLLKAPNGSYEQTRAISTLFLTPSEKVAAIVGSAADTKQGKYVQYYLTCLDNTIRHMSPTHASLAEQVVMSTPCAPDIYFSFEKTSPVAFGFSDAPEFIYAQQHPAPEEFQEPVKLRVFLEGKNLRSMDNRSNTSLTLMKYSLLLLLARDEATRELDA